MKRSEWVVLRSIQDNGCPHTHLICNICGTQFIEKKRPTKITMREWKRLLKSIEADKETHEI
jgi:hypothetical protein